VEREKRNVRICKAAAWVGRGLEWIPTQVEAKEDHLRRSGNAEATAVRSLGQDWAPGFEVSKVD